MRRLPDEEQPPLLGWFAACLMLSAVVVAAFLLVGDISSPPKARLLALPQPSAASVTLSASACDMPTSPSRNAACEAGPGRTALIVADR